MYLLFVCLYVCVHKIFFFYLLFLKTIYLHSLLHPLDLPPLLSWSVCVLDAATCRYMPLLAAAILVAAAHSSAN